MKCPHCTISIHESWRTNQIFSTGTDGTTGNTNWRVQCMHCPECKKAILRYGQCETGPNYFKEPQSWTQFHPSGSSRPPLSKEVPPDIAKDYSEAAKVLQQSPKASAALSRRCLQSVLRHAGYEQKDLSKQIDAVLGETDRKKASLQVST